MDGHNRQAAMPRSVIGLVCALVVSLSGACGSPGTTSYLDRRARFQTRLLNPGPAPLNGVPEAARPWASSAGSSTAPERVREVRYRSGALDLKAWVHVPGEAGSVPAPALVYLHGGIGVAESSWIGDLKPFLDAGFVIMLPTFRGEMGNPGQFEFVLGEVEDAAAAVAWLATQPFVNREQIYAFGWSYGGYVSAMLSLFDELALRHSGSSGGLASPVLFEEMARMGMRFPFDRSNAEEFGLRSLVGNLRWMKRRHYAYVGVADSGFVPAIVAAKREMARGPSQLEIVMVPGEHFAAAAPAINRYFDVVRRPLPPH